MRPISNSFVAATTAAILASILGFAYGATYSDGCAEDIPAGAVFRFEILVAGFPSRPPGLLRPIPRGVLVGIHFSRRHLRCFVGVHADVIEVVCQGIDLVLDCVIVIEYRRLVLML